MRSRFPFIGALSGTSARPALRRSRRNRTSPRRKPRRFRPRNRSRNPFARESRRQSLRFGQRLSPFAPRKERSIHAPFAERKATFFPRRYGLPGTTPHRRTANSPVPAIRKLPHCLPKGRPLPCRRTGPCRAVVPGNSVSWRFATKPHPLASPRKEMVREIFHQPQRNVWTVGRRPFCSAAAANLSVAQIVLLRGCASHYTGPCDGREKRQRQGADKDWLIGLR